MLCKIPFSSASFAGTLLSFVPVTHHHPFGNVMFQVSSFRSAATLTSGSHTILTIDYAPSLHDHYVASLLLRAAATRIHRSFPTC